MTESVSSVLCGGKWTWNPDNWFTVRFKEDGTGEVWIFHPSLYDPGVADEPTM